MDLYRRLGRRERQTSLASLFIKQSHKNEGSFDRPELVQQTLSFQVTEAYRVPAPEPEESDYFADYNREAEAKYEEQLDDCRKYQEFLDKLTPEEWVLEQKARQAV